MAREAAARSSMREGARRRAQEQSHGGGGGAVRLPEGVQFFKNEGKTVELDFIPFKISGANNLDVMAGRFRVGDLVDAKTYFVHRDIGVEQKMYVCPTSVGKPCPICEAYQAGMKNAKMDSEEVKALKRKERVLYNVIDANDKEGKIMVWDVSYHLFTRQLEHEQREREEYYDYADPDAGYTLRIRFEKAKGGDWYEADRIDFDKRNPLSDADLAGAVDFDAALNVLDYKKLEAIFLGVDGEPDGGTDERPAAAPTPARGTRPTAPAPAPAPAAAASARGGRNAAPVPAPTPDPHRRDPDTERARGVAPLEEYKGELDEAKCPHGGVFGQDEGALKECNTCAEETWKACRDEQDRRKREQRGGGRQAAPAPAATAPARGGSEDQGRSGRGGRAR